MIYNKQGKPLFDPTEDYALGADLIRRPIGLIYLGNLKYLQSFCIYDGKYYSTDGSHIAEQDSSFSVLRDVSINIGHGNAFQLGSNGVAYVSGWDDQKVYAVDLATLTVINTITLPTTGYTTCAIDDVKKIAYIWQRDTPTRTETYYNFIVYDYQNEQIINQSVTTEQFAAMQAVDTCMDLMLVLNGVGTSACPNGYRVYDRNGQIVGKYVIPSQSTNEPEGVFIDRTTHELYVSFVDKKLYKIVGS